MTAHPIYRVQSFQHVAPYTLRIHFDDETEQVIDFEPVLAGKLFRPLRARALFRQVQIDAETHPLVWPNGADFDQTRVCVSASIWTCLNKAGSRSGRKSSPANTGSKSMRKRIPSFGQTRV